MTIYGGVQFFVETMLLYEQVVDLRSVGNVFLIQLSENARIGRLGTYTKDLETLIEKLRQPSARLLSQPVFKWNGVESPCFRFELHKSLMNHYEEIQTKADREFECREFDAASASASKACDVARRLVKNHLAWTSMPPEYKCSAAPFHIEFLLALVARSLCRKYHALFLKRYACKGTGVTSWKMGDVETSRREALDHVEKAHGYASLSTLLWATKDESGQNNTNESGFEKELLACFHHTASYCSGNFGNRLAHAAAVLALTKDEAFADMNKILDLNERLYHLQPDPTKAKAPAHIAVEKLLC